MLLQQHNAPLPQANEHTIAIPLEMLLQHEQTTGVDPVIPDSILDPESIESTETPDPTHKQTRSNEYALHIEPPELQEAQMLIPQARASSLEGELQGNRTKASETTWDTAKLGKYTTSGHLKCQRLNARVREGFVKESFVDVDEDLRKVDENGKHVLAAAYSEFIEHSGGDQAKRFVFLSPQSSQLFTEPTNILNAMRSLTHLGILCPTVVDSHSLLHPLKLIPNLEQLVYVTLSPNDHNAYWMGNETHNALMAHIFADRRVTVLPNVDAILKCTKKEDVMHTFWPENKKADIWAQALTYTTKESIQLFRYVARTILCCFVLT